MDFPSGQEPHKTRYLAFIQRCLARDLPNARVEKHHVLPRSLGGGDEASNIIKLTLREHYLAHLILWKYYGKSMRHAFWLMSHSSKYSARLTSKEYARLREDDPRRDQAGRKKTEEEKQKIREHASQYWLGKSPPDAVRQKMSASAKTRPPMLTETRRKHSEASKKIQHPPMSEETKQRIREKLIGRSRTEKSIQKQKETKQQRVYLIIVSDETKQKQRIAQLGKKHPERETEELRQKRSKSAKNRKQRPSKEAVENSRKARLGKPRSKEDRKKISNKMKEVWAERKAEANK